MLRVHGVLNTPIGEIYLSGLKRNDTVEVIPFIENGKRKVMFKVHGGDASAVKTAEKKVVERTPKTEIKIVEIKPIAAPTETTRIVKIKSVTLSKDNKLSRILRDIRGIKDSLSACRDDDDLADIRDRLSTVKRALNALNKESYDKTRGELSGMDKIAITHMRNGGMRELEERIADKEEELLSLLYAGFDERELPLP